MDAFDLWNDGSDIPVFAWQLTPGHTDKWNLYHLSERLRLKGWLIPAYPMPDNISDLTVQRIVVRNGLSRNLAESLVARHPRGRRLPRPPRVAHADRGPRVLLHPLGQALTTVSGRRKSSAEAPKRADGTVAPSPEHVKPHPYDQVPHKPAIGAPGATASKFMSVMQLAILTVVAVASLRSLPAMAGYGLGSVTLFIIPAIFFLVPTALVAAELATGWKGGVFTWVRTAFGDRMGFQAIWLQWVQNVVWYPTQIAFIAASLAFVFLDPNLADSGVYTAIVIVLIYWGSTFITLKGGNLFAKVGSWSGLAGTIFPGLLLILFGIIWLATGQTSQTPLEASAIIPPFTGIASIVLIVSNVLAYAGMEVNAVHANDLQQPGKGYPKTVLIASVLILGVFIFPTIAIAIAVPQKDLG